MRDEATRHPRPNERGAISIGTLFALIAVASVVFAVIKVFPVYTEERRVHYDVDELANKSTVRESKIDDIQKRIERILSDNDLPAGSISLVSQDKLTNHEKGVQIQVNYSRTIDLLVTSYVWKVNYKALGKTL
ncbi:MAG TPA: hypothetical protein VNH22_05930 [Blastocatellia bacterium]|jgi:type II secretory pathway component PulL|nr:hypothetical protein [Blastocatellia bacterium]